MTIDENMTLLIKINGKVFAHTEVNIETNEMSSANDLEMAILAVHGIQICHGCPDVKINKDNAHDLFSFAYSDGMDVVHHRNCQIILNKDEIEKHQCKYCKIVKQRLNMKIIRRQHAKKYKYLKISDLSPKRQLKIKQIMQKLNTTNKSKERAQTNIRLQKKLLNSFKQKMTQMSKETLDTLMNNHENISPNEKTAVHEIFKATSIKNPKGRRYSD